MHSSRLRSSTRRASAAVTAAVALLAIACRGDSPTAPPAMGCGDPWCYVRFAPETDRVFLKLPIDDALARVVPTLASAEAGAELHAALVAIGRELADDRAGAARMQIERAYETIARLEAASTGATATDVPELTVVRLAIAPTAVLLGVPPR